MTNRKTKIISALAAFSIAATGLVATSSVASAAAPSGIVAQQNDDKGVVIVSIQRDGPAAKAGLRRGDILLTVDGKDVSTVREISDALSGKKAGDKVDVTYSRNEQEATATVALVDLNGRISLGISVQTTGRDIGVPPAPPAPSGGNDANPANPANPAPAPVPMPQGQAQPIIGEIRITEVVADSPAAAAGLQKDDVIVAVNGTALQPTDALADVIGKLKPGDEATLTIRRAGNEQDIKVKLGENPDKKGAPFLGIRYAPSFVIERMPAPNMPNMPNMPGPNMPGMPNMPFQIGQVAVSEVISGSAAEKAGLKAGDVISTVNGTPIKTPVDLTDIIGKSKVGDKLTLGVKREGSDALVTLEATLGENPNKAGTPFLGIRFAPFVMFDNMPNMPGMPNMPMPRGNRGYGNGGRNAPMNGAEVFIGEVAQGSPAEKAGLKAGDVISAVNGTAINTPQDVVDLVGKSKIGDKLTLSIKRDDSDVTTTVEATLGENPDKKGAAWLGVSLGGRAFYTQPAKPDGMQGMLPGTMQQFGIAPDSGFFYAVPAQPSVPGADNSQL